MGYILVTGCNGLIGKKVTHTLLEKGYKVLGLSTGNCQIKESTGFKYAKVDLIDCISIEKLFRENNIVTVIHLAAIAHLKGRKNIDWNKFYRVNALASKNLFKIASEKGANVFYASTVDVYGNDQEEQVLSEKSSPQPVSNYAKSKYIGEKMLEKYSGSNHYLIARFAPVYGAGFMKDVYKRLYLKYPTLAFTIGKGNDYHFVSVNNIVGFILLWLDNPKNIKGVINIADNKPINSVTFLKLEKEITKPKWVIYIPKTLMSLISKMLNLSNKILPLNIFKKIDGNLNKLVKPARYSIERMKKVYSAEWNLENTIYKDKSK